MEWKEANGGVTFGVKVIPRASRTEIAGMEGDLVRIRLNAPPVEGRANEKLVEFLADLFHVAKSSVEIVSGDTARRKLVRLRGVHGEQLEKMIRGE